MNTTENTTTHLPKKIRDFVSLIERNGLAYDITVDDSESAERVLPTTRYEINVQHPVEVLGSATFYFRTSHPCIIRDRTSTRFSGGYRFCMGEMRRIETLRHARINVLIMTP